MRVVFVLIVFLIAYGQASAQGKIDEAPGMLNKYMCNTCHAIDSVKIGPSYTQLANTGHTAKEISALIIKPIPSNWPDFPPMVPMAHLPGEDVDAIARWILTLKED